MSAAPSWMNKVLDALDDCLQWHSPGVMAVGVAEGGELLLAPAGAEVVGGRHDGESVYPLFTLDVSQIAGIFDTPPFIFWHTHDVPSVSLNGKIDDEDAIVMIFSQPFSDDDHRFRVYQDGSFDIA